MSVHIEADLGQIAESVLLPGDPLRAKWIAENYLENAVLYNNVRGMLGYTGYYKGKRVSVQGTGMGIPSSLIYIHELINDYQVKNLIRVGTAGSYQKHVMIRDTIIAMSASTTSNINNSIFVNKTYSPTASFDLFQKAILYAGRKSIEVKAGNVLSADQFYEGDPTAYKLWAEYGVLAVEMEAAGLYTLAAKYNVNALAILSISDSLVTGETISSDDRESSLDNMIDIALNII